MRARLLCSVASLTLVAAAAFAPSTILHAQDDPSAQSDTSRLSVTSRLVVLDVVVLDRDNKPVLNLDQSKFSVYEDKVQQKVRYCFSSAACCAVSLAFVVVADRDQALASRYSVRPGRAIRSRMASRGLLSL